ncbi:MAG: carbohydrate-binding family 9-like protein [Oscillospiraceae bacterium]
MLQNMYTIKTITDMEQLEQGNVAEISIYNWNCQYQPPAYAQMCYIKDKGFGIKLSCKESNPLARYTEPNCMVCEDSCLEAFVNFKPEVKDKGYINFEANVNGSLLCEFGEVSENRKRLISMGLNHPEIQVLQNENEWGYILFVSLDLIEKVYGNSEFKSGEKLRGNFFKCGDKTQNPHYGSFTKIDWACPSFHRPQFFSDMIIG